MTELQRKRLTKEEQKALEWFDSNQKWRGCYESGRGDLFTKESNRHPAKMAVGLCFRIFEHGEKMGYWKKGDYILDPMAGVLTTGIVGACLGYKVLGLELEPHFIEMARANVEFASKKFHPLGACEIWQGDARKLSESIFPQAVVSSPPYAECLGHGPDTHPERTHSPQPIESYDAAINSPPFLMPAGGGKGIAKLGHRLDPDLANRQYVPEQFSKNSSQIGNLPDRKGDLDAVLSSPPWEDQQKGGNPKSAWNDPTKASEIASQNSRQGPRTRHSASPEAIRAQMERDNLRVYGASDGQIGNSSGETYLSAMLQVYHQLWLVLKPGGVVALVTKNPVKNKQIRRLDLDTIALMEKVGFVLLEHKLAMLAQEIHQGHMFGGQETRKRERKSFFKRLHERKFPELAVDYEDVLFFRKS